MSQRVAVLAALTAGAFALVTTGVGMASGAPLHFLLADGILGLTFLVAGLSAVWLRPTSPTGPLLLASTFLWFVGSYAPTNQPVVTHLGFAFERYYDLALAALLLSLAAPSQALRPRWLIVALAVAMAARSIGRLVLADPSLYPEAVGIPPNPFAVWPNRVAFETVEIAANGAIAVLVLIVGGLAVYRLMTGGPVARRARWPILGAGAIAMAGAAYAAFAYAWMTAGGAPPVDLPEPGAEVFAWAVFGTRVLVPIGFVIGTLRLRSAVGPLVPLAQELGRPGGPDAVTEALRRALGDPSLELWRADPSGALPPTTGDGRALTLIGSDEAPLAAIVHDPALHDQPELMSAVTTLLRLTLDKERLESEIRDQLDAVRESRARIVTATQEERRRLERDLHDGAQQRLIALTLALQRARASAEATDVSSDVQDALDEAAREANDAIRELRELARGIHPAILEEEGLGPAIGALARRATIPVEVQVDVAGRLSSVVEATAYFTIAEALTNAQRHSAARSASVRVARAGQSLEVEVLDDGHGGADPAQGSGLRGLADRVNALGGRLAVESPPGRGTTIRATIPLQ
jgi:signal transduction histidine kinase